MVYPDSRYRPLPRALFMTHDRGQRSRRRTNSVFYDDVQRAFRVQVAEQEVLIEARARAVRKPEPGATDQTLGVAFVNLTDLERLALHAYVNSALVRELELPLYA
jgi:hypothetical protein